MTPGWPSLEQLQDPEAVLEPLARMDQDLRKLLIKGLGADNFAWPIVSWRLTDGTETGYDNPISGLPTGFFPLSAKNVLDNTPLMITGWQFNDTRPDRKLGITVSFGTASATGIVKCWLVGG